MLLKPREESGHSCSKGVVSKDASSLNDALCAVPLGSFLRIPKLEAGAWSLVQPLLSSNKLGNPSPPLTE